MRLPWLKHEPDVFTKWESLRLAELQAKLDAERVSYHAFVDERRDAMTAAQARIAALEAEKAAQVLGPTEEPYRCPECGSRHYRAGDPIVTTLKRDGVFTKLVTGTVCACSKCGLAFNACDEGVFRLPAPVPVERQTAGGKVVTERPLQPPLRQRP